MKVLIWVHKNDVINGKITDYHLSRQPQTSNWTEYIQIEISRNEFVRLEDREDWKVAQYNRNREYRDMIDSSDEISEQDNQPFGD